MYERIGFFLNFMQLFDSDDLHSAECNSPGGAVHRRSGGAGTAISW
jgi:hypothetical protein